MQYDIWDEVNSNSLCIMGYKDGWWWGMQRAKKWPAERPMKSRILVAPSRHKEVCLAVMLRVMCLHLNQRARKERGIDEGRERNTGWSKRLGILPSQDTWGMQQQLLLSNNIITVPDIWVRKTAFLVESAGLAASVNKWQMTRTNRNGKIHHLRKSAELSHF